MTDQPLCRYCGAKIRKATEHTYIRTHGDTQGIRLESTIFVDELPQTKQQAQRLFNQQIVSVRRNHPRDPGITQVSTWDGESYEDKFFCNGSHAKRFAYLMAKNGHCTAAYNQAAQEET